MFSESLSSWTGNNPQSQLCRSSKVPCAQEEKRSNLTLVISLYVGPTKLRCLLQTQAIRRKRIHQAIYLNASYLAVEDLGRKPAGHFSQLSPSTDLFHFFLHFLLPASLCPLLLSGWLAESIKPCD